MGEEAELEVDLAMLNEDLLEGEPEEPINDDDWLWMSEDD